MKPWQTTSFKKLLQLALAEDLDSGDATSDALIPDSLTGIADITTKSQCVIAGQRIAEAVFREVDTTIDYNILVKDGDSSSNGRTISTVSGKTSSILAGERVALNFLQRLSGIATAAHEMTQMVSNTACRIVDTRKTVPGLRILDKYAVRMGGAHNHRMNLGDGILIKDNHIKACGGITNAVKTARLKVPHTLKIQIEVTTKAEADEAVTSGADSLLLDNMQPDLVQQIVECYGHSVLLECSGNLTKEKIREYAETGVHILSIGALTHSVCAADISLNLR
ncbi:carboxylating nicotinate-nucleotide diphosphorylase [bacterium]|nr:carboxylating nicotinate-nucleotide diphosphorylase [candidate division CSSED10-310 bacterium]